MEHPVRLVLVTGAMAMIEEVAIIIEEEVGGAMVATEGAGVATMKVVEVVALMEEVGAVIEVVLTVVIEGEMMEVRVSLLSLHPPLMVELGLIICLP